MMEFIIVFFVGMLAGVGLTSVVWRWAMNKSYETVARALFGGERLSEENREEIEKKKTLGG